VVGVESLLRSQWSVLRTWLEDVDALASRGQASGLGSWTVGDLVAHLGYGLGMLAEIEAAPPDAEPLSLGRYVSAYPPAASTIAEKTHELALSLSDDLLGGIDAMAEESWRALDGNNDAVVMGRRGPLTRDDYLLTRLIELVLHGDDLHRALPGDLSSPVLPDALAAVSDALATAYTERAGAPPDVSDPAAWVRLAGGRTPSDDLHLPLL
jgi:uncharacterized protein (TIGR03083 family)